MGGERRDIDGGHAWLVLGAGWTVNVLIGMLFYSTGVVNKAVLDQMGEGVVKTSWVGSTFLGTVMLSGPLTGTVAMGVGCRYTTVLGGICLLLGLVGACFSHSVDALILTYGITVGLGIGLTSTAASVAVGHYFDKLRPLASGILVSGAGCGMLAGAPLVRLLFDTYGLGGMFLVLGALASHACAAGMLFRPSVYERKKPPERTEKKRTQAVRSRLKSLKDTISNFFSVLNECSFVLYAMSYGLWSFGEAAFHVHLPNYAEQKGTSPQNAAMLFTAMGITSMIARILAGFAGSDPNIGTLLLHTGMLGVSGSVVMIIPLMFGNFRSQVVVSALYGLYAGGPMALLNPICVELLGVERLASGYGMNNLFGGIGLLTGPPFAGVVYNATGNFDKSFILAGSVIVLGGLVSLPIVSCKRGEGGPVINTHLEFETVICPIEEEEEEEGEEEGDLTGQSKNTDPLMSKVAVVDEHIS